MSRFRRKFTKHAINARRAAGLTQDEAAEKLGCSEDTLYKYEAEKLRIRDDVAARMSVAYRDPRLRRSYCAHECAVGALERRESDGDRSAPELMLDLLLANSTELPDVVRTLRKITADDVIDEAEEADCARCLSYLAALAESVENLKARVEYIRMGRKGAA